MNISLKRLEWLRHILQFSKYLVYTRVWGMDFDRTVKFSLSATLDRTNPRGVHIGSYTYISHRAMILAHDLTRHMHVDTYVGSNCFIGAHAIVMPGIRVNDNCIVGAGAVVTKDVPTRCAVAGNPAKIIRQNIAVLEYGYLVHDDES